MNQLTFTSATQNKNGETTVYLTPTNSRHVLSLSEVQSLYVHVLNTDGSVYSVFPVQYDDDGVWFTLKQLGNINTGTYAFYLELKYSNKYSEYYPDSSVKYMSLTNDTDGNLALKNIFNADYNNLKPLVPPTSPDTDGGILDNDDMVHRIKIAQTVTLPADQPARVEVNKDTIKFYIPKGMSGQSAYQAWLDAGHTGSENDFLNSLVVKTSITTPENRQLIKSWINDIDQANSLGSYTNVRSYGATGDGTTDDTQAIQNAINDVPKNNGGLILFPTGTYKITSTLTLYANTSLYGTNIFASVITMDGQNKPFFKATDLDDVNIKNLTFNSVKGQFNGGITFDTLNNANVQHLNVENVQLNNSSSDGFTVVNPLMSSIKQVLVDHSRKSGFNIYSSNSYDSNISMESCFASNNEQFGFKLDGLTFSNFTNCVAEVNYGGFHINNVHGSTFNACGEINNHYDGGLADSGIGYNVTNSDSLTFNGAYSDKSGIGAEADSLVGMHIDSEEITINSFHQDGRSKLGIDCTDKVKNSAFYSIKVPDGVQNNIPDSAQINPVLTKAIKNTSSTEVVNYYNNTIKPDLQKQVDDKTSTALTNLNNQVKTATDKLNQTTAGYENTMNQTLTKAIADHAWTDNIDPGTNLNTVKKGNLYNINGGTPVVNKPTRASGNWATLIVAASASNGMQIYSDTPSDRIWYRTWEATNNWKPWVEFGGGARSIWYSPMNRGENKRGQYISDLTGADNDHLPKVGDLVINAGGHLYTITTVNPDPSQSYYGTFDYGTFLSSLVGPKGDQGAPATYHQVVDLTDAKYDRNKWYPVVANTYPTNSDTAISYWGIRVDLDDAKVPYGNHNVSNGLGGVDARQAILYSEGDWDSYVENVILIDNDQGLNWLKDGEKYPIACFDLHSQNNVNVVFYARGGLRVYAETPSQTTWTINTTDYTINGDTFPVRTKNNPPTVDDYALRSYIDLSSRDRAKAQLMPKKGVDYWTDADINDLKANIKAEIEDEVANGKY